jgi:CotS family spore coat protein
MAYRRRSIQDCAALAGERLEAKTGTEFDQIVARGSAGQLALADEALATLGAADYGVLCNRYQALSQVIHGDPAGRNFVCTEYGQVRMIDLETVRQDIPAADLAKLMRRVLKKHKWDSGVARAILERYQSILPLEPEMMPLIYTLLAFPTKFYRDLHRYYADRQDWSLRRHLHKFRKHLRSERGRPALLRQMHGVFWPSSDARGNDDGETSG